MKGKLSLFASFAFALTMSAANAQFINELCINPPTALAAADNGFEFIELKGTPGATIGNVWFLSIEGDGVQAGAVDQAIPLTGMTFGSNGLLLIRDASTVLNPAPAAGTNVVVMDFNPDMENGTNTFALVQNYTGYVINSVTNPGQNGVGAQTDIDANNDGVIGDVANNDGTNPGQAIPWAGVLDAVSWDDGGATDFKYAVQMSAANGTDLATGATLTPDAYLRLSDGTKLALDFNNVAAPVPYNDTRFVSNNGFLDGAWIGLQTWSPGLDNPVYSAGGSRIVNGIVDFGAGWAGNAANVSGGVSLNVEVYDATNTSLLQSGTVMANASTGAFSFSLDNAILTNNVIFKLSGSTFLKRSTALTLNAGGSNGVTWNMLNGNVDGNGLIDISDYLTMVAAFDTSETGSGYDPASDINKDGFVDISDYLIMVGNFDQQEDN